VTLMNKGELKLELNRPEDAKDYFEKKMAFTTGPAELKFFMDEGQTPNIVDVRASEDFNEGHIPGARSLPEDDWPSLKGLTKDRVNVIYCYSQVCHLAARASAYFARNGFPVMELEGGIRAWKQYYPEDLEEDTAEKVA